MFRIAEQETDSQSTRQNRSLSHDRRNHVPIGSVRELTRHCADQDQYTGTAVNERRTAALQRAFEQVEAFIDGLDRRPVGATASPDELRARLASALPERGLEPVDVIDELVAATREGLHGSTSGRFFAWVIGGTLDAALAADWLTACWNQNAALSACSPAAAAVEEVAGKWLKELLDLPREASFAFTTGCQLAHFTCLAAARDAVLQRTGWEVNRDGLSGAPAVRIIASDQRHASVDRAIRFLGFGDRSIRTAATGDSGQMETDGFRRLLEEESSPTIVVLNAADLNVAAFDDFPVLIPMARAAGAWVHVDGAFGLMARASCSRKPLTEGVELADSWATDTHKWLNVPFDCGFAVVRDRAAHQRSMSVGASYISHDCRSRDQLDWNPEWSRRARGFAVYAALRELGRAGMEAMIDRCCENARGLVQGMGLLPGCKVVCEPRLNQGLVRFPDPARGASETDHDRRTDQVIALINATGEAFFSGTTWKGKRAMRVSVVNWRTSEEDVRRSIAAVASVLKTTLQPLAAVTGRRA